MCHQSIIAHVYLMFNTCLLENVDVHHQIQKSIKYFISISSLLDSYYFYSNRFTDMKSNGVSSIYITSFERRFHTLLTYFDLSF